MAEKIKRLISETRTLRLQHRAARRGIEAAACRIREIALSDALAIVLDEPKPPMTWRPPDVEI